MRSARTVRRPYRSASPVGASGWPVRAISPERGRCGYTAATRSLQRVAPVGLRVTLAKGVAKVYVYNSTPFRRLSSYRKAQYAAKSANRGLWRTCW